MSSPRTRRVKVTRAQVLAAQLLETLNHKSGVRTDPRVSRVAAAGRDAGITLPAASTSKTVTTVRSKAPLRVQDRH